MPRCTKPGAQSCSARRLRAAGGSGHTVHGVSRPAGALHRGPWRGDVIAAGASVRATRTHRNGPARRWRSSTALRRAAPPHRWTGCRLDARTWLAARRPWAAGAGPHGVSNARSSWRRFASARATCPVSGHRATLPRPYPLCAWPRPCLPRLRVYHHTRSRIAPARPSERCGCSCPNHARRRRDGPTDGSFALGPMPSAALAAGRTPRQQPRLPTQ
jgi:hypothetical protein